MNYTKRQSTSHLYPSARSRARSRNPLRLTPKEEDFAQNRKKTDDFRFEKALKEELGL